MHQSLYFRSISNKPKFLEGIADNNMYKIISQFIAIENMRV